MHCNNYDSVWFHDLFLLQEKGGNIMRKKNPSNFTNVRFIWFQLINIQQVNVTKFCTFKAMVFPVVMCGYEGWSIKKAEHQIIDVFKLWCWRRLLRVPWTARRSNQSILKEINPEYSLEGLMLKLKLQDFGHLRQRVNSLEKTLMLGKIEGKRRRGEQRMKWLDSITDSITCIWALWQIVEDRGTWTVTVHEVRESNVT